MPLSYDGYIVDNNIIFILRNVNKSSFSTFPMHHYIRMYVRGGGGGCGVPITHKYSSAQTLYNTKYIHLSFKHIF